MNLSRTSTLQQSNLMLNRLRTTQAEIAQTEQAIATGKQVHKPSDAGARAGTILDLQTRLSTREQEMENLLTSQGLLDTAYQGLADSQDLIDEAIAIASSQIGVGSDAQTREQQAVVVQSQIDALLSIANRQFNGVSVFGGRDSAAAGGDVFVGELGGVRFLGAAENLQSRVGATGRQDANASGVAAFGALSSRVAGGRDLNPAATADTRLDRTDGARGRGVQRGTVEFQINATRVAVDLSDADTMGDVAARLNAAIAATAPGAGSVTLNGSGGFNLNAAGGNTLAVADPQGGRTAADLGLDGTTATGGTSAGDDLQPHLTATTRIADLAGPIDLSAGIRVEHAGQTVVIDTAAAQTLEDLQNAVADSDLGLRLEIRPDNAGLALVSEIAGLTLSVGEAGGTTAGDLGLRSFAAETELADFRHGIGVQTETGVDDFEVRLHDGSTFGVNLDDAATVQDVIDAVATAEAAAGVAPGSVTVDLTDVGNGLRFTDNTAGGDDFIVYRVNQSHALEHLGFAVENNAGAGSVTTGTDTATVRVENVFTHLIALREALVNNDSAGITLAGSNLQDDVQRNIGAQGAVSVQSQRLDQIQETATDQTLTERTMLAQLQDADLTEVATRFQQLQLQLQASLRVGSQNLQQSLLDYLR